MPASPRSLLSFALIGVAAAVPAFAQGTTPAAPPSVTQYPACTSKPTDADTTAAHGAWMAGKGSLDEADYPRAVDYFRDAYRRDCTKPEILAILARAYELKGDKREAVAALEAYVARAPNAPDVEVQKRHIANLKKEISDAPAASVSASAASASASASAPPLPSAVPSASVAPIPSAAPSATASAEPPPAAPGESHEHTIPPWVLAGGGAAGVIAGGILYVVGAGKVSDAENVCGANHNQCPPGSSSISSGNSGRSLETVGVVVGGVGLGAVAGGLLWHFLEPTGPSSSTSAASSHPVVSPAVGPGYAGVGVGGRF